MWDQSEAGSQDLFQRAVRSTTNIVRKSIKQRGWCSRGPSEWADLVIFDHLLVTTSSRLFPFLILFLKEPSGMSRFDTATRRGHPSECPRF